MSGDTFHERMGDDFLIVWDGEGERAGRCPGLLSDFPRPSTLAPLAINPKGARHEYAAAVCTTRNHSRYHV